MANEMGIWVVAAAISFSLDGGSFSFTPNWSIITSAGLTLLILISFVVVWRISRKR